MQQYKVNAEIGEAFDKISVPRNPNENKPVMRIFEPIADTVCPYCGSDRVAYVVGDQYPEGVPEDLWRREPERLGKYKDVPYMVQYAHHEIIACSMCYKVIDIKGESLKRLKSAEQRFEKRSQETD